MTDSHCHIAGEEFAPDLAAVVERARAAGVTRALVILAAEDVAECARAATVLAAWPDCRFAVGIHPHHAHLFAASPADAAAIVATRLDALPMARAIGERRPCCNCGHRMPGRRDNFRNQDQTSGFFRRDKKCWRSLATFGATTNWQ